MVRHILLLTLRKDAKQEDLAAVASGFDRLKEEIPEIAALRHGPALQLPGSSVAPADYAVALDFVSEDAFAAYLVHPSHQAFVQNTLRPLRTGGMSAQIAI